MCLQVERDFEAIHDNEELGMIDYSVICPTPPAIGAVVVVDPFSSGECVSVLVVFKFGLVAALFLCVVLCSRSIILLLLAEVLHIQKTQVVHCSDTICVFLLISQVPTLPRWCCCGATN